MFRQLIEEVRFVVETVSRSKKADRMAARYGAAYGGGEKGRLGMHPGAHIPSTSQAKASYRQSSDDSKKDFKKSVRSANKKWDPSSNKFVKATGEKSKHGSDVLGRHTRKQKIDRARIAQPYVRSARDKKLSAKVTHSRLTGSKPRLPR